jgi:tetratricopeptide (TPR) repeat protein
MQKIAWTGMCFCLILMFLFQLPTQAQSKKYFVITGKIVPESGDTGSGVIEITKNGKDISNIEIPKNGRFRLELEFFNEFSLNFKYPGHFSKIINVSTQIPQEVWARDNDFPPFPMIVQLLKEFEGIDKSFTLKPLGRIFYGKDIDNFEKESYISDFQFLEQIETAKSQANQVQKEAQSVSKENAQDLAFKQKSYDQILKEADANYQRGEYQMALLKYQEAKKLFPDKAYAGDRVAELQDLVKALEITEKQKAELEQKYKDAIALANGSFDRKNYLEAKPKYEEALQYKPGDVYANGRINEINQLLALLEKQKQYKDLIAQADKNYQSKNFDQAITLYTQAKQFVPEEQYPQNQINQIALDKQELSRLDQLEKEFNQTMQSANSVTQQKDYLQALNLYNKALGLKPDSKLVKDKIEEINQAIAGVENDKKYLQAIQIADQALASNDLIKAKAQYQEAIKFKSGESYPKTKLSEISKTEANEIKFNELVSNAEKAFADKNFDEALTIFNQALAIKPQDQSTQKSIDDIRNIKQQLLADKEYADLIAQADQSFRDNKVEASLDAYNKALQIKKTEAYPKEQIQKIGAFQSLIKRADQSFNTKDYSGSMGIYNEAIAINPNDTYISGRIAEIKKILDTIKQLEEKEKAELMAYNAAIEEGDALFAAMKYSESLTKFKEASGIKTSEKYPQKKIKEIENILDAQQKELARKEKEYQITVAQADKMLKNNDYSNSKNEYQKALEIKPDETYPKDQIRKIDEAIAENIRLEQEKLKQQQEKLDQAFNQAMADADRAFGANDFSTAKSGYENALTIKTNDATAKDKLGKTEAKLAEIARLTQAYNTAIDAANKQLTAKNFQEAKGKYQEALQYLPDSDYPKRQIAKIDEILAQFAAEAKLKSDFEQTLAEAESLLKLKELTKAKDAFTKAYNLIPSEPVPPKRISEINAILAEQAQKAAELKATMEAYQKAVDKADKFLGNKEYTSAQLAYNEALLIKADEKYPVDQLALIDKLLKEQNEQNYKTAIAKADNSFENNQFDEATSSFKEALKIKKDDQYATKKLIDIEQKKLEIEAENIRLKKLDEQYKALIADADNDFKNKTWPVSKEKYNKALVLKPTEVYPKDQIRKIDEAIAENIRLEEEKKRQDQEKLDRTFNEAMAAADQSFGANDFSTAKSGYENALTIKTNDATAKDKLGKTEAKLAEIARLTQAYNTAIDAANKQLTAKNYQEAKGKYQEALQYLPDSDYPKRQIAKIDEVLVQQESEAKLKRDFDQAVAEGENLLNAKELLKAKDAYMKAYNLIPSEPVPPKKISEINALLAEQLRKDSELKATMEAYQAAIKKADSHFSSKEYSLAQLAYNEALLIKADEKYPVEQLALIDKLLKEQNDQSYKTAIAKADNSFNANQFDDAINSYQEALKFRNNDQYATNRLKEIEQKKLDLEAENNRLKKLNDQYNTAIADANNDFRNKVYPGSKEKYQKALALKPNEVYPKDQIAKIDQIMGELQKAEDLNRQYDQFMKDAQTAFDEKKLKEARDLYMKGYNLKPNEPVPPMRIAQIDAMLAQLAESAKLAAMEEAQRAAKEKADRDQYNNEIAAADKSFTEKQYRSARMHYTSALTALPNEKYPKDQIIKCDELQALLDMNKSLSRQKAIQDSIQSAKDKLFDEVMLAAKDHDQNSRYQEAIQKYKEAITIKPDQRTTIQKYIQSIEDKLQLMAKQDTEYKRLLKIADDLYSGLKLEEALNAYRNAQDVKPAEDYPKRQIIEIQSKINAVEESYAAAIKSADLAFDASEWINAKAGYNNALAIKPKEQYPLDRLNLVNQKITDSNLAEANELAETKAYNEAIEKARKLFSEDQLNPAKMQYQVALTIKPNEKLPVEKIKEIDALLEQRDKDKLAQAQRELEEKYRQAISVADNSFKEKAYSIAKLKYQQSLLIKPNESYPQDQMALIDKLLSEAKVAEVYVAKIPVPETPKAIKPKINLEETDQAVESRAKLFATVNNYDDAVKKADESFGIKDYSVARFYYYKATEIKPTEDYPLKQIDLIRKLIDSQLSTADITAYDQAISQADKAFLGKNYPTAKFFYYKALGIKSWEKYPKDRIDEINALTNSLLSDKEEKEYRDIIAKADEAFFNQEIGISRFYYNKAISIKKEEEYPKIKLKDIKKLIDQARLDQLDQEYVGIIEAGDQAMKEENYSIARFNYNKALSLRPAEKYPKDQLKLIKETLDKK